ncbi:L,D-transpeptidase family protein [Flavobacterium degerlachei]|uniref:Murein L,D-transpeptidase YcbB/YkuD n=1 Tax=Flavobacterium degerlachei TaxID=229203 RepID=A0A1H2PZJ2_9FLAO|nr:L,D-transpeptidase family protein [Flavobacterium degerlachei]SDW00306.1 Murein L,D-transpeptidase YcbB/YkuD [Flavobacterium degerlachei]
MMKNFVFSITLLLLGFFNASADRDRTKTITDKASHWPATTMNVSSKESIVEINISNINLFFQKYPKLNNYKLEVIALYENRNYNPIWYDSKGLIEFANLLYFKVGQLENEGLKFNLAYRDKIAAIFNKGSTADLSPIDTEIMLSTMYIFYAKKVFHGIDTEKFKETDWFLPRKNISYVSLLDSLLAVPKLLDKNEKQLFGQYYKLRNALRKYREIEKSGDWPLIETNPMVPIHHLGDSSKIIGQVRHRLFILEDLQQDSKSNIFDQELMEGVLKFNRRNGYNANHYIGPRQINRMNTPIAKYIKTIIVNMERCRWIPPALAKDDEFIIVNVPSFKLIYFKNGERVLESKVFVGINMMETVIFSSNISRIVFSPYWNVPRSIIENEIKPAMKRDPDYLEKKNMEWNNGHVRQKPGEQNALGLVKFVFPNTYDIYLHDTPFKTNFEVEIPMFSHGCINMQKAKELALMILKDNPNWPPEKIIETMNGGKETTYVLNNKIPIHIGYFTAWVNDADEINFYFDIYHKDNSLSELLFNDDSK